MKTFLTPKDGNEVLLGEEINYLEGQENYNLGDVGYIVTSLVFKAQITQDCLDKEKILARDNFDSDGFVYALWLTLDEKFKIVDKLCSVIDFSKIFGAWGAPLDLVKKRAIRALIRYVIIPAICGLFKLVGKDSMVEIEGIKREKPKTKKAKK
jgi:hypothetical protein